MRTHERRSHIDALINIGRLTFTSKTGRDVGAFRSNRVEMGLSAQFGYEDANPAPAVSP
jgi:hypothetical protein